MTINRDSLSPEVVVLVHGLWMAGPQLGVLKHHLQKNGGLHANAFSYPSISKRMSDHAQSLLEFVHARRAERVHFVGHSLGGIVVLRALEISDGVPPGRVVLLGTPLQGCRAARAVGRLPFGRAILGASIYEECIECGPRQWTGSREVGVIAGSSRMGLGRLFANLDTDHDGTVLVEETQLPGAKDHVVLPTSHTGMLLSAKVAEQAAWFLREGKFRREGGND